MKKSVLNILIGGPAGSGIESAGHLLGQALNREGASVVVVNEIMSLIRGGHNYNRVRFSYASSGSGSSRPVSCHDEEVDIAVVFDKAGVVEHLGEVRDGGVLVYEASLDVSDISDIASVAAGRDVKVIGLDLAGAAKEAGGGKAGSEIYRNIVALGVVLGLIGEDLRFLEKLIREKFASKGTEVVDANLKALKNGASFVEEARFEIEKGGGQSWGLDRGRGGARGQGLGHGLDHGSDRGRDEARMLLNGNDAVCLGSVAAGCKFVAAYPMTPASSIMATMAAWGNEKGIVMKHAEDEIAAMNMIVGAGFAGARAMTATSGGGFALMTEAVGLAGCAEVPCVIVESQRVGPSTGLPTRTEQGDLRQVMHASQGDYPRLVMAPGDVRECFEMAFDAFNFADKYQIPVLLILDKYLSEALVSTDEFSVKGLRIEKGKVLNEKEVAAASKTGAVAVAAERARMPEQSKSLPGQTSASLVGATSAGTAAVGGGGFFKRYADSPDGVSPRILPGTKGGEHVTTSYETDEFGDLAEDRESRVKQMEKRMRKMDGILKELPKPTLIGGDGAADVAADEAEITFVAFGSMKPILEEVVERLGAGDFGGAGAGAGGRQGEGSLTRAEARACALATLTRLLATPAASSVKAGLLMIKHLVPFQSKEVGDLLRAAKRVVLVEQNFSAMLGGVITENTGFTFKEKILKYDGRQMDSNYIIKKLGLK